MFEFLMINKHFFYISICFNRIAHGAVPVDRNILYSFHPNKTKIVSLKLNENEKKTFGLSQINKH